jgi:hypothetical protein
MGAMRSFVIFRRAADRLDVQDFGGFQNRNASVIQLTQAAFAVYRRMMPEGDWAFGVYTGDDVARVAEVIRGLAFPVFAFARSKRVPGVLSFPCFSFHAWVEAGIRNYQDCIHTILMASTTPPSETRCFWIGNTGTHKLREVIYTNSLNHQDVADFRPMQWQAGVEEDGRLVASHYVSLADHCAYPMLLDIRGAGYSGRRKFLLHSGRPVLVVDGEFTEYWAERLVPWVHYVPVPDDGRSLFEVIRHLAGHPELARAIGRQGQRYALEQVQFTGALKRIVELIDYAAAARTGRS